jgi:hypothetical protein
MKVTNLLAVITSCFALIHGRAYADSPNHTSEQLHAESAKKAITDRVVEPGRSSNSRDGSTQPTDANGHKGPTGYDANASYPAINAPGSAAKQGSRGDKAVTPPVQPHTVISFTSRSPQNVRHHGPANAIISGSVSTQSNTAAINGTGAKRKP